MLDELTPEQWEEWKWILQQDPPGGWRDDWRACRLLAALTNMLREKGKPAVDPWDLMPPFGEKAEPRRQTAQQMATAMMAMVGYAGAKVMLPAHTLPDGQSQRQ